MSSLQSLFLLFTIWTKYNVAGSAVVNPDYYNRYYSNVITDDKTTGSNTEGSTTGGTYKRHSGHEHCWESGHRMGPGDHYQGGHDTHELLHHCNTAWQSANQAYENTHECHCGPQHWHRIGHAHGQGHGHGGHGYHGSHGHGGYGYGYGSHGHGYGEFGGTWDGAATGGHYRKRRNAFRRGNVKYPNFAHPLISPRKMISPRIFDILKSCTSLRSKSFYSLIVARENRCQ